MKMYSRAFNKLRELQTFVNENGIPKENIINIFQSQGGNYILNYYAE